MREVLIEVGTQVVFELLMLVIGVAFAYLSRLTAKSRKLEHISAAMGELEKVVKTVVGDLQQTVVEKLKADSEDGKLTNDEIASLGELLLDKVIDQISYPTADTIRAAGIDIEDAIHSMAEAYIAKIKRESAFLVVGEASEAE